MIVLDCSKKCSLNQFLKFFFISASGADIILLIFIAGSNRNGLQTKKCWFAFLGLIIETPTKQPANEFDSMRSGLLMFATILIIITNSFDNFLTISPTLTGDNASAWLDHDHVSWVSPFYSVWASLRSHFRPTPSTYEPLLVLQALKLFSLVEKFSVQLFWAEVSCVRLSMLYRVYTQQMSFCIMTKWYVI